MSLEAVLIAYWKLGCVLALLLCVIVSYSAGAATTFDRGLVGYWKLGGDCKDSSRFGNHGENHGADLTAVGRDDKPHTAARFDGKDDYIEVPDNKPLKLGAGDLSISVWVKTERALDDVLGDIVSKYDPALRKGLNFTIVNHAGMTSSQSNYRNVHFGVDNAKVDPTWTDCGQPGNAIFICATAVHVGNLYVGTFETGAEEAGHVYRYDSGTKWVDCGSPDKSNSVMCLAVYEGQLYAGTARYRAKGSALPESPNNNPGGHVWRYEGDTKWVDCGRLAEANDVYALVVYRDELYAIPMYSPGVFRFDGKAYWEYCGTPGERRSMSLAVFNGSLYSTGNGGAGVWRYAGGTDWSFCGEQEQETQTYAVAIHEGAMYVGTWPNGSVFRYEGGERWTNCGRLGDEKEVMGMAVYNGKMYAGTLPLAQVYRYDGDHKWTLTGQLDTTPDVVYRRVWTMAVYQGKLFTGTLPSGHVFALEAGKNVTHDYELAPGWRHLVAIRDSDRLKLAVDGELVAISSTFNRAEYDLSNNKPLKIGFGAHDYFNGSLAELRLYSRALSPAEVQALYTRR